MDVLDPRDQSDPMDVMDSRDQLDSRDVMDSRDQLDFPVQKGKREIKEYSYEGLLDYKVQATSQGEFAHTVSVIQTIYLHV